VDDGPGDRHAHRDGGGIEDPQDLHAGQQHHDVSGGTRGFLLIREAAGGFVGALFGFVVWFTQACPKGPGHWCWNGRHHRGRGGLDRLGAGEVGERCIVAGTVLGMVMTSGVIARAGDPMTIDATFLVVIWILFVARGVVHSAWTTASAETLEVRIPTLIAT
jgi:hypothetical protein